MVILMNGSTSNKQERKNPCLLAFFDYAIPQVFPTRREVFYGVSDNLLNRELSARVIYGKVRMAKHAIAHAFNLRR
jgi:hypothetical protein